MTTPHTMLAALLTFTAMLPAQAALQTIVGTEVVYTIDLEQSWLHGLTADVIGNTLTFTSSSGSAIDQIDVSGSGDREILSGPLSGVTVQAKQGRRLKDLQATLDTEQTVTLPGPGTVTSGGYSGNVSAQLYLHGYDTSTPARSWLGFASTGQNLSAYYSHDPDSNVEPAIQRNSYGSSFNNFGYLLSPTDGAIALTFSSNISIGLFNSSNNNQIFANAVLNGFGVDAIVAPVPEPFAIVLMGLGLAGLVAARRRKTKH
ncbi:PEP-CTERM sorting domain-containing protein [Chitinibacteraceae bacterium HSL-7]